MARTGPLPTVRRHPFVGLLGGLLLGAGIAVLAVTYGLVALGTIPPLAIVVGGTLLGGVWGRWGPVRTVGTPPKAGQPQADLRVRQAMDENVAAIDRAEKELREAEAARAERGDDGFEEEAAPTGPLPDIGPPGEGIWPGEREGGSGKIGGQG
jgi:hypothetical protein